MAKVSLARVDGWIMKALMLLAFAVAAGCATTNTATKVRETRCVELCAKVLHPMSLARSDGPNACTCWAPTASYESARPVTATIHFTDTQVASR